MERFGGWKIKGFRIVELRWIGNRKLEKIRQRIPHWFAQRRIEIFNVKRIQRGDRKGRGRLFRCVRSRLARLPHAQAKSLDVLMKRIQGSHYVVPGKRMHPNFYQFVGVQRVMQAKRCNSNSTLFALANSHERR